jgi:hypothetical protein
MSETMQLYYCTLLAFGMALGVRQAEGSGNECHCIKFEPRIIMFQKSLGVHLIIRLGTGTT